MTRFMSLIPLILFPLALHASHHSVSRNPPTRLIQSKNQQQTLAQLRTLIEAHAWNDVGLLVNNGLKSHTISLDDLHALALNASDTPFAVALKSSEAIIALQEKTGLSLAIAFPIALFAETSLADDVAKGTYFWSEDRFKRELQYDPETKRFFIHLGTKGVEPIGEGRKKVVTKTILYDQLNPEVMARGVTEWDITEEMDAMRALKGLPCLLQPEALMTHTDSHSKKQIMTIVTKIFRPGSLQSVIDDHSLKLTIKERLKIAYDILKGMSFMHGHHYVHRDLGARNYFVRITGKKPGHRVIDAVVADMGRTIPVSEAIHVAVQGNSSYISPEGFFRSKMATTDYYSSDIFAVGCVLWQLHYGHMPAWSKERYYARESLSLTKRYKAHMKLLKHTRARPLQAILHKTKHEQRFTLEERFLELILRMTDPDPTKRGTATELKNQCRRFVWDGILKL